MAYLKVNLTLLASIVAYVEKVLALFVFNFDSVKLEFVAIIMQTTWKVKL